jgi:hypothetical protein
MSEMMRLTSYRLMILLSSACCMASATGTAEPSADIRASVTIVPSPDSDGDGLTDANEAWLGTLSTVADTDGDGLSDGQEYIQYGTDPLKRDSDGDLLPDGWEVRFHLNPLNTNGDDGAAGNPDLDNMDNLSEYIADTDPTRANSRFEVTTIQPTTEGIRIDWMGGVYATQYLESGTLPGGTGGEWRVILTNIPPTALTTNVVAPTPTNNALFYRVRATR